MKKNLNIIERLRELKEDYEELEPEEYQMLLEAALSLLERLSSREWILSDKMPDRAMSWSGFNLYGDDKSISELKHLVNIQANYNQVLEQLANYRSRSTVDEDAYRDMEERNYELDRHLKYLERMLDDYDNEWDRR